MIFTSSVIAGFRSILGSFGVQLAMGIIVLFCLKVPANPYGDTEPNPGDNSILQD
jgi:hypothetical protein